MTSPAAAGLPAPRLRDAAFEAAWDAIRYREDNPELADRLIALADEILAAPTGEQAIQAIRTAPADLRDEIAGATTDPHLTAAITGGNKNGLPTQPAGRAERTASANATPDI